MDSLESHTFSLLTNNIIWLAFLYVFASPLKLEQILRISLGLKINKGLPRGEIEVHPQRLLISNVNLRIPK